MRLAQRWRANADMLAEGNKDEFADPAVGMQRACADDLEALVGSVSVSPEQHSDERAGAQRTNN